MPQFNFAQTLLNWHDQHGRKHLPWQQNINAYRVWISEIMLQQTQVDTVIPYFERFIDRFPNVDSLANAHMDEVLHLWTGLGYYSRARNLHKCAQHIVNEHQSQLPNDLNTLASLPGIGPSTAAAISAIAFNQPNAILDGNVKRVLSRFHAVAGWPGKTAIANTLWQHAHAHIPKTRCAQYTQAIMDFGATLCTRSKPQCEHCPMARHCQAKQTDNVRHYPESKPKTQKPVKHCQMLIIHNPAGHILLQQRPATGIWGGLWSLPEIAQEDDAKHYVQQHIGKVKTLEKQPIIKHVFSHYTLMIQPQSVQLKNPYTKIMENNPTLWYNPKQAPQIGLASPVKKLLHG